MFPKFQIELIRLMFGKKIFSNCVTPAKIGYARYYENDGLKYRLFYTGEWGYS